MFATKVNTSRLMRRLRLKPGRTALAKPGPVLSCACLNILPVMVLMLDVCPTGCCKETSTRP